MTSTFTMSVRTLLWDVYTDHSVSINSTFCPILNFVTQFSFPANIFISLYHFTNIVKLTIKIIRFWSNSSSKSSLFVSTAHDRSTKLREKKEEKYNDRVRGSWCREKRQRRRTKICQDRKTRRDPWRFSCNSNCLLHYVTCRPSSFHQSHSSRASTKIKRPRVFYEYIQGVTCQATDAALPLRLEDACNYCSLYTGKGREREKKEELRFKRKRRALLFRDELFRKCRCYGGNFKIDLASLSLSSFSEYKSRRILFVPSLSSVSRLQCQLLYFFLL